MEEIKFSKRPKKKKQSLGSDPNDSRLEWLSFSLRKYVKCKTTQFNFYDHSYTVNTYSVFSCSTNGKIVRYGSDDFTYRNYPELLTLIPRGFSELYEGKQLVYSMKGPIKFDGTSAIDEDDCLKFSTEIPKTQHEFLDSKIIQKWADDEDLLVEWQEKANGKFAIFTLLELHGKKFIFGGSKNVHKLVPLTKNCVLTETTDELHYQILKIICDDLRLLSQKQFNLIFEQTIVGEYVDGMHLVWTPNPYMVYFSIPKEINLRRVKAIMPSQNTIPSAKQLKEIRNSTEYEGVVIVYRNRKTDQIFRQKHKTIWYILLRCWREILSRKNDDENLELVIESCQRRSHERSHDFLNCTEEELNNYDRLASVFITWISKSDYSYKDVSPSRIGMAKIYHEFLCNPAPITDDRKEIKFNATQEEILNNPQLFETTISLLKRGNKIAVILRGLPGCGKTTIGDLLEKECKLMNVSISRHCTDNFYMIGHEYVFDVTMLREYHSRNYKEFSESTSQLKINENTNTKRREFNHYMVHARKHGYIVIVLECKMDSLDKMTTRNSHNVPKSSLKAMKKRYEEIYPIYYGTFPNLKREYSEYDFDQKASHITHVYVGQSKKNDDKKFLERCGEEIKFEIIGLSINDAGKALVVETKEPVEATPHITLSVNNGFTSYDVGKKICIENTKGLNRKLFTGILSPMY